ncbi:hypothetical protein [Stenotrophomonas sp.]|uniref:hypothetical protein n=1 Tax=Stenotrophomonas sp. TaxID=69392 RepID=UPI00289BA14E|nr:hypothetical protein [Stenotrophomonas sp.]
MREITAQEMMAVSGGELEYTVSIGPVSATGSAQDFGNALAAYSRVAPLSGFGIAGKIYQLMAN